METESVLTFSPCVMEALKLTKDLKSLDLTNVTLSQDFLNEICKLKSSRKFIADGTSITPEFVEQLAFSKNPIEYFMANEIIGNWKSISNALKVLYKEKKNTMKTLSTHGLREEQDPTDHKNCKPLPNFNMCPNITYISEPLHMHDLELISDLPKLERLSIYKEININYLKAFHKMNFSNLKYLYLDIKSGNECNRFIEELANVQFPCLKRLYVTFDKFRTEILKLWLENAAELVPLNEKTLENLITKIPSISIVLNIEIDFTDEITHQFMLKMLIYENFLISFSFDNDRYDKNVERFFEKKGTAIYNKWKSMRDECYKKMRSRFIFEW